MTTREQVRDIVRDRTQICVSDEKCDAILKSLQSKNPTTPLSQLVETLDAYSTLPSWLLELVTINETFFFRHPEQFRSLEKMFEDGTVPRSDVRALCGGMSTGEEVYSLAMLLQEQCADYRIVGVDVDPSCVEKARNGVYNEQVVNRCAGEYMDLLRKYTEEQRTPRGSVYGVSSSIKEHIRFTVGNIFRSPLENYDIVFLRNILIYFDPKQREGLVTRLVRCLRTGGVLVVGAGEIVPEEFQHLAFHGDRSMIRKVSHG